jgi:tetratricopeptide (TPR) repeat protein
MAAKILVPKGDLAAATLVCAHSIQVALIGYSIVVNCAMMTVRLAWPAVVVIALLTLAVSKLPNEARAQGPDELASLRAQVSQLYSQGKYAEAVPIAEQYVALARQKLGDNHAEYAAAISWLANVYQAQGRYAEAEPLHKRSLAIVENAVGPDHSYAAAVLNNLAELYYAQGRYPEAEPLYKRALAIREKALGPEHPAVGQSLNNLSGLYFVQRDWARAADFWRRSTGLIVSRAQRVMLATGQAQMGKQKSEAEQLSFEFWGLVKVTYRLALNERNSDAQLRAEMFQTAQWAQSSEAAQSLQQWQHAAPRAILVLPPSCGNGRTGSRNGSNATRRAAPPWHKHPTDAIRKPRRPTQPALSPSTRGLAKSTGD